MPDQEIPEAVTESDAGEGPALDMPQMPPLVIGDPFAIAYGAELVDRSELEPGTTTVIKCMGPEESGCGQAFRVNLLDAGFKTCPKCGQSFTHLLLFAPVDDDEIIRDAMVEVLASNGYALDNGEDEGPELPEEGP
jgi:hypothetical protein